MRRARRRALPALVAALVATGGPPFGDAHDVAGSGGATARPFSANPSLGVIGPAPPLALLDLDGRAVSLAELRGRVVLLSFIYTSCPSACPLVTQRMAVLQRRLTEAGLFPSRASLVSVTVDPDRDSVAVLARYAKGFGADPRGWTFLRERREALGPVLAAWGEWTKSLPNGEIDHPARLYLLDPAGRVREIYSLSFFDERQAFLDIRALLREPGLR